MPILRIVFLCSVLCSGMYETWRPIHLIAGISSSKCRSGGDNVFRIRDSELGAILFYWFCVLDAFLYQTIVCRRFVNADVRSCLAGKPDRRTMLQSGTICVGKLLLCGSFYMTGKSSTLNF